jgi:hypothetical protein
MRSSPGGPDTGRAACRSLALVALALVAVAMPAGGCRRGGPVSVPEAAEAPSGIVEPASPAAVALDPVESSLRVALEARDAGRLAAATEGLESLLAMGGAARGRALYPLALLLARPDSESRDTVRAASLLEEYVRTEPDPSEEASARLILGLLDLERLCADLIGELRGKAAASGAESEDLRLALAQREAELRRIKDILLGRSGGL